MDKSVQCLCWAEFIFKFRGIMLAESLVCCKLQSFGSLTTVCHSSLLSAYCTGKLHSCLNFTPCGIGVGREYWLCRSVSRWNIFFIEQQCFGNICFAHLLTPASPCCCSFHWQSLLATAIVSYWNLCHNTNLGGSKYFFAELLSWKSSP